MPALNQTHFTPRTIPWGEGSRARWAVKPSGTAVIFVHGYGGGATDTWDDFADLLPDRTECAGHDLIFYGYASLTTQAPISAALFRDFLDAVAARPFSSVIAPSLRPDRGLSEDFRYTKVILVAHSLGAVVVREALLQAASDTKMQKWLPLVRLALFAPAHTGAKITELAEEAIGAVKFRLSSVAKAAYKAYAIVLGDLERGSPTLIRLEARTVELIAQGYGTLRAEVVVFGQQDKIVWSTTFGDDPGAKIELGKGHKNVCKPSPLYLRPIEYLLPLLTK